MADDTGKDQLRILAGSARGKQPPATSNIPHLDGSRKSKRVGHPTLRSTNRLEKKFDHVTENQALKAMKRTRSRQTAPGYGSQKTVGTTQSTNEARTLRVQKKFKTTRRLRHGAPESPMLFTLLVDTLLAALNKTW